MSPDLMEQRFEEVFEDEGLRSEASVVFKRLHSTIGSENAETVAAFVTSLGTGEQTLALLKTFLTAAVNTPLFFQPTYFPQFMERMRSITQRSKIPFFIEILSFFIYSNPFGELTAQEFNLSLEDAERVCRQLDKSNANHFLRNYAIKVRCVAEHYHEYHAFITVGLELMERGIDPTIASDFLAVLHPSLQKSLPVKNWVSFLTSFFDRLKKSRRMSFSRILHFIVAQAQEHDIKLEDLETMGILIDRSIYPTPTIVDSLKRITDPTQRGEYLKRLSHKIDRIKTQEEFNPEDDEAVEMYYNHLNINVHFDDFKETVRKPSLRNIPPPPSHFRPFRISAHGVEAVTHRVNLEMVRELKERLISRAQTEQARQFLLSIPGLPKNILPRELKEDLIIDIVFEILDWMEKENKISKKPPNPFHATNVLGKTEATLLLTPSFKKIHNLRYALYELDRFIKDTEEHIKKGKFTEKEQAVFRKNQERAQELRGLCRSALLKDLDTVVDQFQTDPTVVQHLDTMTESFMELRLAKAELSPEEQRLYTKLSQALSLAATAHVPMLSAEFLQKLLSTAVYSFYLASIENPEARKVLWQCLELHTLLSEPAMVEEIYTGKPDLVLINAHELFQEKIPGRLREIMGREWEKRADHDPVGSELNRHITELGMKEIREILKHLRSGITGLESHAKRTTAHKELLAAIEKFRESFLAKCDEVAKLYDHPPSYIKRDYNGQNTQHLLGSCKFHLRRNSTFDKMRALPDLGEGEAKIINTLEERLRKAEKIIEIIYTLFAALERADLKEGEGKFPVGVEEKLTDLFERIQEEFRRFPAYTAWVTEKTRLEGEYKAEKETRKKEIYDNYFREAGGTYNPAVIGPRIMEAVKEIDKKYSGLRKEARMKFEREHQDILPAIEMLEKLSTLLERLKMALHPIDHIQRENLLAVSAELGKISYENLEPDEFELVPSKTIGDVFKGCVSDDCSKDDYYDEQILNENFVNYRVYQKRNGERIWVGNVYVLDATYSGYPVLLFDAIQVSRSTSVNAKAFLQGVIEGFRQIAEEHHYRFIISNEIEGTGEGWLVSNRPQLRQAYIDFTEDQEVLISDLEKGQAVDVRDTKGKTFQSLTEGDDRYKVLWKHPDVEFIKTDDEVLAWVAQYCDEQLSRQLAEKARRDPFRFGILFRSSKGFAKLEEMERASPEDLRFYLNLMDSWFFETAAHAVIHNLTQFTLLKRFHHLKPTLVSKIIRNLIAGYTGIEENYMSLADLADKERKALSFVEAVILEQRLLPADEDIEHTYALYKKFATHGLGDTALREMYRMRKEDKVHFIRFADFMASCPDCPVSREILKAMMHYETYYEEIDLPKLYKALEALWNLNPEIDSHTLKCNPGHVLAAIHYRKLTDVQIAQVLADTITKIPGVAVRNTALQWATLALSSGAFSEAAHIPALFDLLLKIDTYLQAGEVPEEEKTAILSAEDFLATFLRQPSCLPTLSHIIENLMEEGGNEKKRKHTKYFLTKAQPRHAAILSTMAEADADAGFFYLTRLPIDKLDDTDTLATLEGKFKEIVFSQPSMTHLSHMRSLHISGNSMVITDTGRSHQLAQHFSTGHLSTLERVQLGETARIREKKLDEEVPVGYKSIGQFMDDQVSVYDLDFHR